MSVGGRIIEKRPITLKDEDDPSFQRKVVRYWVLDATPGMETETCVNAKPAIIEPQVGDAIWWQSGRIYFDGDRQSLEKVGTSFTPPAIPETVSPSKTLEDEIERLRKALFASICREHVLEDRLAVLPGEPAPEAGSEGARGIADIAAERQRQISAEGWTPIHDDRHVNGEMALAAAAYARHAGSDEDGRQINSGFYPEDLWPAEWWRFWKPKDRRSDLVRAGALIAAEIDRIDRAALRSRRIDDNAGKGDAR